jgi:type IV pilus assembly protein PilY1
MFMSRKHFAWATAIAVLTMVAGSATWADDVELLVSTPGESNAAKPNILFILDSSGSMTTIERSQEPYSSSNTYTGPCDLDKYYWTTNSSIPSCGNQYNFYKTEFYCAQGKTQAASAGAYTDTMTQYREETTGRGRRRSTSSKWTELDSRTDDAPVECRADSGVHGDPTAGDPTTAAYAQSGSDRAMYTSNKNLEVSWGSSPTQEIVTVYDSNYLNWYYNPPGTSMSRTDIVKTVTKNVLGSIRDVNVGFMRYNDSEGGDVIQAVKDLDSNRTQSNAIVDSIPANGWTPLAETMYEAALYWTGQNADYGRPLLTDPDALRSTVPMAYDQPVEYACSKNFIVYLTDGEPTYDTGAWDKAPTLPNFSSVLGRSQCTGSKVDGACLDDISEYLSKADINPNVDGTQTVTTYTIGFTTDLPILKQTAEISGGEYYLASDVKSLTAALTDIVTDIFDRDISFTAPAVAVNAFNRTQNLNDLYVSVFRATDNVHWPGNMKKYLIKDAAVQDKNGNNAVDPNTGFFADNSQNFWSSDVKPDGADVYKGGAANKLPDPAVRKVYTDNSVGDLTLTNNALSVANIASFTADDFALSGAVGEPSMSDLIDWARGVDVKDEDNDPNTLVRHDMGDTLHSQPAAVVYGDVTGTYRTVVFNATNDGYLHAIDASTGTELWSYIPHELLSHLKDLYFNENVDYKTYGIDGDIVPIIADLNNDGVIDATNDFVYIVFGMRRGGSDYYLLDVTDPNRPVLKWVKSFPEFGQSWSSPVVAKVKVNSAGVMSPQNAVLILGAGYDTSHDSPAQPSQPDVEGAGIFMLDLESGEPLWRAGRDSGADLVLDKMTRSIPSRIRVIDFNGDGFADRMYASDLGGQIWRFDITNGQTPDKLVAGGVIARLGAEGIASPSAAQTRRFYTSPDVAMFVDKNLNRRMLALSIGSGYRAHPLDISAADRFYSLRDADVFNKLTQAQYDAYPIITDGDLPDVSGTMGTVIAADGRGWKLILPPSEKVLSDSRTFDDSIYFVTMEPRTSVTDPCQAGLSTNRLYRVSVQNGDPVWQVDSQVPTDPEAIDAARVMELQQGGIAPVPVFLFPTKYDPNCTGSDCRPEPIACVGVECFDPDYNNYPVRTLWTQDGIE